jgi:hypothetical protein
MEVARPGVIGPSGTAYLVNMAAVGCCVENPEGVAAPDVGTEEFIVCFARVKHNESHDRNILVGTVA